MLAVVYEMIGWACGSAVYSSMPALPAGYPVTGCSFAGQISSMEGLPPLEEKLCILGSACAMARMCFPEVIPATGPKSQSFSQCFPFRTFLCLERKTLPKFRGQPLLLQPAGMPKLLQVPCPAITQDGKNRASLGKSLCDAVCCNQVHRRARSQEQAIVLHHVP